MAETKTTKKRRVVKKSPTVREQAAKAQSAAPKPRRVKRAANKASRPLKAAGRGVKKAASPFSFLLWPFRLRPVRWVGRVLYKIFLIGYFVNSWKELRQVTWPNRRTTLKLTLAVFVFALSFALVVTAVDYGLDKIFRKLLL